jgi:hypothetical protein
MAELERLHSTAGGHARLLCLHLAALNWLRICTGRPAASCGGCLAVWLGGLPHALMSLSLLRSVLQGRGLRAATCLLRTIHSCWTMTALPRGVTSSGGGFSQVGWICSSGGQ